VLEKAIFHGLEKQPIDEYMNRDVHTVPPTATLLDIQKFLVEYQQRILAWWPTAAWWVWLPVGTCSITWSATIPTRPALSTMIYPS